MPDGAPTASNRAASGEPDEARTGSAAADLERVVAPRRTSPGSARAPGRAPARPRAARSRLTPVASVADLAGPPARRGCRGSPRRWSPRIPGGREQGADRAPHRGAEAAALELAAQPRARLPGPGDREVLGSDALRPMTRPSSTTARSRQKSSGENVRRLPQWYAAMLRQPARGRRRPGEVERHLVGLVDPGLGDRAQLDDQLVGEAAQLGGPAMTRRPNGG